MAVGYPGGINTYIPTLDISGNLMVEYSRNWKSFALNRIVNVRPTKKPRGVYLRFNPKDQVRIQPNNNWNPGNLRPVGFQNSLGFEQVEYTTKRYNYNVTLDQRTVDVTDWPIMKSHSNALGQQAMTNRSVITYNKLTTSGTYDAAHVKTSTQLGGWSSGFIDGGSTADPRIKKVLDAASQIIQKATGGRIRQGQLSVAFNSKSAQTLSVTRELREYVMQNPDAWKNVTLDDTNLNHAYGLPARLYGYNVVVDDTFYNPENRGSTAETDAPSVPAWPDNTALVFLREGDLEVPDGGSTFSTCHLFAYEDMTVETFPDTRNRLVYLDVTDEFVPEVVSKVSAVLVTNLFS